MKRTHPILTSVAAGVGAAALPYLGYAAVAWSCYGTRQAPSHPPLDPFIPWPEVVERHETQVDAPADVVFAVSRKLDFEASPVVRAIFRGRELLLGAKHAERNSRPFLERVPELGWGVLAEEPRHIAFSAAAQPWNADVKFITIPPQDFAAFAEPGFRRSRGRSKQSRLARRRRSPERRRES